MNRELTSAARAILDLVYPERCVHCGTFGTPLCPACAATMIPATGPGRCVFCSARWDERTNCPRCFDLQALDGVRAAFEMEGAARKAVHELKYRFARNLAPLMAGYVRPLRERLPFDVVYPVPLHRGRERMRGFNQAELLLAHLDWPRAPGQLRRIRRTDQQVGMHLKERRQNVSGAFAYAGPALSGLVVAVLDDVITTGATANACAEVLLEHGAKAVYAVGFARASHDPRPEGAIGD